jgi:acyl carrier protein
MGKMDQIKKRLAEELKTIGLLQEMITPESYDKDILLGGMIDSFGFVQFLIFVENEYNIDITEEMQFEDRLRTINGMAELIQEMS